MSQPASPPARGSTAGMFGAMVVVVLLVVGWVGFRAVTSNNDATPIRTVEWAPWVKAGRTDHQLSVFAPVALPTGWRATSVNYVGGSGAYWHLGLLTDKGKYVGIDEARTTVEALVQQYIDKDAVKGKDVIVGGQTWQTWTDSGGDYALARSVRFAGSAYESVVIGGAAPASSVRDYVATLRTGRVHLAG